MKNPSLLLTLAAGLLLFSATGEVSAADISGEYKIIESSKPGGGGGYTGKLAISAQGPAFKFDWTLDSGETYSGPALMLGGVAGAGYGDGLTGLAIYSIKGKTLSGKWLLPNAPKTVGEYGLVGTSATLGGSYKFTNGLQGGVTIKPNGKVFDINWTLPTGNVTGVGIRVGDVLVAVSGNEGTTYGVAVYRAAKDKVEGVWTVAGQSDIGTENLVSTAVNGKTRPPETDASAMAAMLKAGKAAFQAGGASVQFAGGTYRLQHTASAPGQATSEIREYLRDSDNFDTYSKMVALRLQKPGVADPVTFARGLLAQTKKEYPDASTNEIGHDDDSATVAFVIKAKGEVEFNFWHYFKTARGIASVQFVLRNKPPFNTEDEVKAEAVEHVEDYLRDARALAPQVVAALDGTAKSSGAATAAKEAPAKSAPADDGNDDLAAKIAADFKTAGGIAGQFLELLKADKFDEATALIAPTGFTQMKTTPKEFAAKLQKTRKTEGKLVSFAPDRTSKPDFGPENGGIYMVLAADSKFDKGVGRETLRFFRFRDGSVKMIGYEHAAK